ncbi:MAG: sulfatase/phosphatase domain-containing protein, partial [Planctomycetota bacterium]
GGLRTPIMVRWPRKVEPRRDESTPVSSADLAPTVLKACGLAPVPEMQGIDLLDSEALRRRKAIFGSVHAHDADDYMQPASNLLYRWGIDGWWKLILPNAQLLPKEKPELYDLQNDPLEKMNLATERPEQVEKLRAEIDAWWPGR